MKGYKRPELLWRILLVGILVVFGLLWLPSGTAPVSSDLRLELPESGRQQKLVALTFDDGPHPEHTGPLLDGLKERGVKATFFLVGTQIQYAPQLVERMAREGHQIGVHTYSHVTVAGLGQEEFRLQVEGTRRMLYSMLGEQELWLRPPYGILDENVQRWADSPVVLWSVDPEDWRDDKVTRIKEHLLTHVRDGDIILMHDIYPSSVEAALQAVDELHAQGFRFVTVEELMELRGITPESGHIYKRVGTSAG